MREKIEAALAFALRCAAASALAYALALRFGLAQPLWASMSAVVVSQERLHDTRASMASRIAGTAVGAAISIAIGTLGARFGASPAMATPIAVGVAALLAHAFPAVRVAMWTAPIVLLSAPDNASLLDVGARRATEVLFGACVGWALHQAVDAGVSLWRRQRRGF